MCAYLLPSKYNTIVWISALCFICSRPFFSKKEQKALRILKTRNYQSANKAGTLYFISWSIKTHLKELTDCTLNFVSATSGRTASWRGWQPFSDHSRGPCGSSQVRRLGYNLRRRFWGCRSICCMQLFRLQGISEGEVLYIYFLSVYFSGWGEGSKVYGGNREQD